MNAIYLSLLLSVIGISDAAGAEASPVQIILVGDSTMAPETGYGNAFCARLHAPAHCLNMAKGGRSSASYRSEGSWTAVQNQLRQKIDGSTTYVLIQFGHNDQPGKPGRSTDLATEYPQNLTRYVHDVQEAGAIPVLVTPLTRRNFERGMLQNSLQAWAEAMRQVASAEHVALIDLNADSAALVQKIGPDESDTLAMAPRGATSNNETVKRGDAFRGFDHTHLGAKGAAVFSAMVEQELLAQFPSMAVNFNDVHSTP